MKLLECLNERNALQKKVKEVSELKQQNVALNKALLHCENAMKKLKTII